MNTYNDPNVLDNTEDINDLRTIRNISEGSASQYLSAQDISRLFE